MQFGIPVQFLHLNSNKFLSCNYNEAAYEKENFRLELQEFSSRNTTFKILPSLSHQTRSDKIINTSDIVYIISVQTYIGHVPYINCSKEGKQKQIIIDQRHMSEDQDNFQEPVV